jgi:hypothetical protein
MRSESLVHGLLHNFLKANHVRKTKKNAAKTGPVKSRKEKDQDGTAGTSVQPSIVL